MSPGKSRVRRWRETEHARFDQYLIDSFYSGESDLTADRPVRIIYGTRRLTDELAVREPAATTEFSSAGRLDDSDEWVSAVARGEATEINADAPGGHVTSEPTDDPATHLEQLRDRARRALGPRSSPQDPSPERSEGAGDTEAETSAESPAARPTRGKRDEFSWKRFGLSLTAGAVGGTCIWAMLSSVL